MPRTCHAHLRDWWTGATLRRSARLAQLIANSLHQTTGGSHLKDKLESSKEARFAARWQSKIGLDDNAGATLAMFERTFRAAPEAIADERLNESRDWLQRLTETLHPDDPNYQRAQRLYFDVDMAAWERSSNRGELAA